MIIAGNVEVVWVRIGISAIGSCSDPLLRILLVQQIPYKSSTPFEPDERANRPTKETMIVQEEE